MSVAIEQLNPKKLRTDGGTQLRAEIHTFTVEEYAELYSDGVDMPPVVAFFDGTDYWLADGFHRLYAVERLDLRSIACDVRQGSRRDAVFYAVGANITHGLRRTRADKRACVMALLNDPEWGARSDSWIAEQCGVSDKTVAEIRKQSSGEAVRKLSAGSEFRTEEKRIGKNGVAQAAKKKRKKRRKVDLHVPPIDDEPAVRAIATATNNVDACPNCGCTTRTEDGDCSSCYEPCGELDDVVDDTADEVMDDISAPAKPSSKPFSGSEKSGFNLPSSLLELVFFLHNSFCDWPPSARKPTIAALEDFVKRLREGK